MNCKDCGHWDRNTFRDDGTGECMRVSWGRAVPAADMALHVTVADDHNLNASLLTDAMFGCVQFTQRKRAKP